MKKSVLLNSSAIVGIITAGLSLLPAIAQTAQVQTAADGSAPILGMEQVVVSGSRLQRQGFDQPTPTTVLGDIELRQGDRPSVAEILDDFPSFRGTDSPSTLTAGYTAGQYDADLRGLGSNRTLVLLNGARTIDGADLSTIPVNALQRIDVVTGGASAAWGSGAVAGVVNVILRNEVEGLELGVKGGISSRDDNAEMGADAAYGTSFDGDRGHFEIFGEFLRNWGAYGRDSNNRPALNSALFTLPSGQLLLASNVKDVNAYNGGVIKSGSLAGMVFNPDGSLSPFPYGSPTNSTQTVGGGGGSQYDRLAISSPIQRGSLFLRSTYDVTRDMTVWVNGSFARSAINAPWFPQTTDASATSGISISTSNPFLSPAVQAQLAGGPSSFKLGYISTIGRFGEMGYAYQRDYLEGAFGIDGSFGDGWTYHAHFSHGEAHLNQNVEDQQIGPNFANALDAVTSPTTGQPICRIALTNPTTSCQPLNIFGVGNASPGAITYSFGDARTYTTNTLQAYGFSVNGDPFSTWAGPVSIAAGYEGRRESQSVTVDPLSAAGVFTFANSPLEGAFSVNEGFAEAEVPVLSVPDVIVANLNGAARYSDYSNTGGIWSWKIGGTARVWDSVLFRIVTSRDIRSPSVAELFTPQSNAQLQVSDPAMGNVVRTITSVSGGNPNLTSEIGNTTTIGGSYAPDFIPNLNVSLDYYSINIDGAIGSVGSQTTVTQCASGNTALCSLIVRDGSGNITKVFGNSANLASYKTNGVDIDVEYQIGLDTISPELNGQLRLRALGTYVNEFLLNNGVTTINLAGQVGDSTLKATTPHYRANLIATYQLDPLSVDLRVRYVGGGLYSSLLNIANNQIDSRIYTDIGAQYRFGDFELYGQINNIFDRSPPPTVYYSAIYDAVGRNFSGGVRVHF